jgi:hypothetical protein
MMIYGDTLMPVVARENVDAKRVGLLWCASARAAGIDFKLLLK